MTASTDQDRADFEALMRSSQSYKPELLNHLGDRYEFDTMEAAWHGFQLGKQTARRASVGPHGWKLAPVTPTEAMYDAGLRIIENRAQLMNVWVDMLAAAPQPPEAAQLDDTNVADMAQAVDSKEAAPVQLPEPAAWRYTDARGHYRYRGARPGFAVEYPLLKPEALYTEQQVRELIAAHGIKEQST